MGKKVQVIDFWAPWCGPCKQLAPTIDEVATMYSSSVDVIKCNIEEDDELCSRYNVKSIPTVVFINESGEEVERFNGPKPLSEFIKTLDTLV